MNGTNFSSSMFSEEQRLEADFSNSLARFGIDGKYIQKFKENGGSESGWDFGSVDAETVEREQQEGTIFARCIELEELMEETADQDQRNEIQWELDDLKEELERIQRNRKRSQIVKPSA
eukprot:TRINITY_DN1160_c0_g1_i1.p1 TRINITY_DN1160_c0_g1~~TRINITY_DN1160_c0_g1_i1.p1  ORF type:complete len:119 (+),score=29.00 TRINITY_DN1160_c0_g1_i1:52-408(+)